jgi:hypothetical protein
MKKSALLLILFIFLSSCGITKTSATGIPNQAFLSFVGTASMYPKGVEVILDDKTRFNAQVHKNRSKIKHLRVYGISTGKHKVSVVNNGKTLYEKVIFLSSQQTKKIILP